MDFVEQLLRQEWHSFVNYDRALGALIRNAADAPSVARTQLATNARTLAVLVAKRNTDPLDQNQLLNLRTPKSQSAPDLEYVLRRITNILIDGKRVDIAFYLVLLNLPGKRPMLDVLVEHRVRDLLGSSYDVAPEPVRQALEAIILAGEFEAAVDYAKQTGWLATR